MRGGTPEGTADSAAAVLAKALTFGLRSKELCLDEDDCTKDGIPHRWTIEATYRHAAPPRHNRGYWLTWCPAHIDTSPMLGVRDSGGKVVVHCWDGCQPDEVYAALKGRGLWTSAIAGPEPIPYPPRPRGAEFNGV